MLPSLVVCLQVLGMDMFIDIFCCRRDAYEKNNYLIWLFEICIPISYIVTEDTLKFNCLNFQFNVTHV